MRGEEFGRVKYLWLSKDLLLQGFYDPINEKMFEPELTGFSYSFTDDGYYEVAYYRAISNRMSQL